MDNKPLITIIDEPEHIEIDMGEMAVITNQNHASLKNLDYENSGHTGFASQSDLEILANKIEGKSQSFTVNTLEELGNLFNLTITEVANSYTVSTSHIIYKGKEYSLYNGNEFFITQEEIPDYWFSLDNMCLYATESLGGTGGIETLIGTAETPIKVTDLEEGEIALVTGYIRSASNSGNIFNARELFLTQRRGERWIFYNATLSGSNIVAGIGIFINFRDFNYTSLSQETSSIGIGNLNGVEAKNISSTKIYAPTVSGTEGQILKSNGSNNAPTWIDNPVITDGDGTKYLADDGQYKEVDMSTGIELLSGTEDNPIIMRDIEEKKWYELSGYVKPLSSSTVIYDIQAPMIVLKPYSTAIIALGIFRAYDDNTIRRMGYNAGLTNIRFTSSSITLSTLPFEINGNAGNYVSIYAPTTSGEDGQILQSNGEGKVPTWTTPNYATLDDIASAIGNISSLIGNTEDLEV